eukprot:Tamp_15805.p3 GENE.Tamp_15805~~Tamp_15805.p3  ORF type:complete len:156 (+),score=11.80 Tamp_15805:426-893(+)
MLGGPVPRPAARAGRCRHGDACGALLCALAPGDVALVLCPATQSQLPLASTVGSAKGKADSAGAPVPPARAQPRAHDSTACAHKATLACARDAHAHSTHLSEGRMAGRSRRQTAGWTGCGISAAWAAARRHTTKQIARGCPHAARLVQWKRRLGV